MCGFQKDLAAEQNYMIVFCQEIEQKNDGMLAFTSFHCRADSRFIPFHSVVQLL